MEKPKILMVCMGNICRSPMAEGVVRHYFDLNGIQAEIDSAGTIGFHTGEQPDVRAKKEMIKHNINISNLRARKFSVRDFDDFDLILTMDYENFTAVKNLARNPEDQNKVEMYMNISNPGENIAVPDPYYGGEEGFANVYQMLVEGAEALVRKFQITNSK